MITALHPRRPSGSQSLMHPWLPPATRQPQKRPNPPDTLIQKSSSAFDWHFCLSPCRAHQEVRCKGGEPKYCSCNIQVCFIINRKSVCISCPHLHSLHPPLKNLLIVDPSQQGRAAISRDPGPGPSTESLPESTRLGQ